MTILIPDITIDLVSSIITYMYEAYFNLKEKLFSISPDPRFIYLTAQHQEALAKVQYAISQRMGVSAIYGDVRGHRVNSFKINALIFDILSYKFVSH